MNKTLKQLELRCEEKWKNVFSSLSLLFLHFPLDFVVFDSKNWNSLSHLHSTYNLLMMPFIIAHSCYPETLLHRSLMSLFSPFIHSIFWLASIWNVYTMYVVMLVGRYHTRRNLIPGGKRIHILSQFFYFCKCRSLHFFSVLFAYLIVNHSPSSSFKIRIYRVYIFKTSNKHTQEMEDSFETHE